MTTSRGGPYVWVTWLSRLMAGDVKCTWSVWFKTHYKDYARAASDFQLAQWQAEHTRLVSQLDTERRALGESVRLENQNAFRVKATRGGLILSGQPDVITLDTQGEVTVYDAKTGNKRQSDLLQVMLYMRCVPYASALYKGKLPSGCVAYKDGYRSDIPASAVDGDFKQNVSYFLGLLEADTPPRRVPSPQECRYCEVTAADCPDRIEWDKSGAPGENESMASLDWQTQ